MLDEYPPTLDREKFKEVHAWSKQRQADWFDTRKFVVTPTHKLILRHLRDSRGGVTIITGPTGSGKTATRHWLTLHLGRGRVISVVWKDLDHVLDLVGGFRRKTKYVEREVRRTKEVPLTEEERTPLSGILKRGTKTVSYTETVEEPYTFWDEDPPYVFIEFNDYSMTHRTEANRDIKDLMLFIDEQTHPVEPGKQDRRNEFSRDLKTNIVVFYQGEQYRTLRHHFLNKPLEYELAPIALDKLKEMYHELWSLPHIFTDEALKEVISISRGNPRWFMKYIDQCCRGLFLREDAGKEMETLTLKDVHTILSVDNVVREWEIEFKALFPDSDKNRIIAENIVRDLVRDGGTMQPVFIERYFKEGKRQAQNCSYVLGKMEEHGCIRRTIMRLPGNPKRVELVERR